MTTLSKRLENVEEQLRRWRDTASMWHARAAAGTLTAYNARQIVESVRGVLDGMAEIPRTAAVATKATEEWLYAGNLATDFTAIENAFKAVGNWVAARDNTLWNGYSLEPAYPWAETVPTFTGVQSAGLQTELTALIAALDAFLSRIP